MTQEEIQADAETQVVPREVADRLADALVGLNNIIGLDQEFIGGDTLRGSYISGRDAKRINAILAKASAALAEYRKAVT